MNTVPGLWWVYDSEQNSFSTLPPGPFLVPGLLIMGFAVLWQSIFNKSHTFETIAGQLISDNYWQDSRRRYNELVQKSTATDNNLSLVEYEELRQLSNYLLNPYRY